MFDSVPILSMSLTFTAKRIQNGSIISSFKPIFDKGFFFDLPNVFCTSCEPEIVLTVLKIKTKIISHSQFVQNTQINQELVVKFWLNRKNYGSVSYSFNCNSGRVQPKILQV